MEEENNPSYCEQDACQKERSLYCKKCEIPICNGHGHMYHKLHEKIELKAKTDLLDVAQHLKEILNSVRQFGHLYPIIHKSIPEFDPTLKEYSERYNEVSRLLLKSIQADEYISFSYHYDQITDLHLELEKSEFFVSYLVFMHDKLTEKGMGVGFQSPEVFEKFVSETEVLEKVTRMKHKMRLEMEKIIKENEELKKTIEEQNEMIQVYEDKCMKWKSEIKLLECKIANEEEKVKLDSDKREEEIKLFEKEKRRLEKLIIHKDKNYKALEEKYQSKRQKIKKLKETISKLEKDNHHDIDIQKHIDEAPSKKLLKIIELLCGDQKKGDKFDETKRGLMEILPKNKLQLPDTAQFLLKKVNNSDKLVNTFLKQSFPTHLKSLVLNWAGVYGINMTYFIENLALVIGRVSSEVLLGRFAMSEEELEKIINNCKCHKLVLGACHISPSRSLSFTNTSLTHLSFQNSGWPSFGDWPYDENRFRLIVEAIGESSMNANLQKINVKECGLSIERMKEIGGDCGIDQDKIDDFGYFIPKKF